MAPVAPWEVDDDKVNLLTQQLKQTQAECSSLRERINRSHEEAQQVRQARENAEAQARLEEDRARELEAKAAKAIEDLKRERDVSRRLQDVLDHNKEEAAKAAKSSRYAELEYNDSVSRAQAAMQKERAELEKRIAQLERQLTDAASQGSTSSAAARAEAQMIELQNQVLALQHENARLLDLAPTASPNKAIAFPFSTPSRASRSIRMPVMASSTSRAVDDDDVFNTPLPNARGRTKTRRRSSSLNPDLRISRLEAEIARLTAVEAESEPLRAKLAKCQRDLLAAENSALASEQRARREREELQEKLEAREDELAELKYIAQEQTHEASDELREQLAQKEKQLEGIRKGITSIENKLTKRVEEVEAGITERKQRSPTPALLSRPASAMRSLTPADTPSNNLQLLQDRIRTLEETLAEKERLLAASSPLPTHSAPDLHNISQPTTNYPDPAPLLDRISELELALAEKQRPSSPPLPTQHHASHSASSPHVSAPPPPPYAMDNVVSREEHEALQEQCIELEKEVEERDTVLEREREQASLVRRELSSLKDELRNVTMSRTALRSQLTDVQGELEEARVHASSSQEKMNDLADTVSQLQAANKRLVEERSTASNGSESEASRAQLAELFTTIARLRTERDDATRSLAFLEAETTGQLDALQAQVKNSDARGAALRQELSTKDAELLDTQTTILNLQEQLRQAEAEVKHSAATATGSASVVQRLQDRQQLLEDEVEGLRSQTAELLEGEAHAARDLELAQLQIAHLEDRLAQAQDTINGLSGGSAQYASHPNQGDLTTGTDFFGVDEFEPVHPRSADSLVIQFDDTEPLDISQQRSHLSESRDYPQHDEEPSFNEAAFGLERMNPLPPSPAHTQSDHTLASTHNSISRSRSNNSHQSRRSVGPPRLSLHLPDDPHAECIEHIEELEARIGRRNEQIGIEQAEIARLEMNLTLAEEANLEHVVEWEKLSAERDAVILERDSMVADCAEARDARNAALRRVDVLDSEIDELKTEIASLQARLGSTQLSPPVAAADYNEEQVSALVREVVLAVGKAQHLETALAEAHEALTEAMELEGHLLEMQTMRDEVSEQLEQLGEDYDRVAGELEARQEEIEQLRDAVDAAQSEASSAERGRTRAQEDLEVLRSDFEDERQRLVSRMGDLQDQLGDWEGARTALESVLGRSSGGQGQSIADQIRDITTAMDHHRSANDRLQNDLARLNEDAQAEAQHYASEKLSLQNALQEKERVERFQGEVCEQLRGEIEDLTARCTELEGDLDRVSRSANLQALQALADLRERSARDLAAAQAERDQAVADVEDIQQALQAMNEESQNANADTRQQLADAEARIESMASDYRQLENDFREAQDSLSNHQEMLNGVQAELQSRVDELKRVNGMKRFLEMDIKKRETELVRVTKERAESKAQVEQHRQRAHAAEIASGTEKVRLTRELNDLRTELEGAVASREEALERVSAAEDRAKALTKAGRKQEIQINVLKEKLRLLQPPPPPKPREEPAPLADTEEPPQRPNVRVVSASSWRRPAFMPQRSASAASDRAAQTAAEASGSRTSLLSGARISSRTSRETIGTRTASASSVFSAELPIPAIPVVQSPAPTATPAAETPIEFTGGKRKRAFEEDLENQRPAEAEAIIVPPSSPSRLRQLAERGLRSFTPKRSPRKKMAQLVDESESAPGPLAPLLFNQPPEDAHTGYVVEEAPPSRPHSAASRQSSKGSEDHLPARYRSGSGGVRPRIRLQDMISANARK